MSDASTIKIDPRDYRLNGRMLRRFWLLIKPYWTDPRHWKSWALTVFGAAIGPAWAAYNYWVATIIAKQTNMLVQHDEAQWYALFWLIFWLGIGKWFHDTLLGVLQNVMAVHWYRSLTEWVVSHYVADRTYYDIALKDDIDNPDERVQQHNVEGFVNTMIALPLQLLNTTLSVITNAALLAMSKSNITYFVVIYSIVALVVQTLIYWPLIRKNFDLVAASADFRYGMLRVRENAETIAFFRGEAMEQKQLKKRIHRLARKRILVYYYETASTAVLEVLELAWMLAPLFLVYPLYFAGKMEFGTIALVTGASMQLRSALTSFNNYIPSLASIAPYAVRMAQIVERHDRIKTATTRPEGNIAIERGETIELDHVCFETPGGEQRLARNVSFRIDPGDSLMIVGQTGVGKSSILRSMAGLWTRGSGRMTMPPLEQTMFVPQKPYMMLGTLREQLLYPNGARDIDEPALQAILARVCLPDLVATMGGLEAERDWGKVLSLGEQQRISFARILISRPDFVFLDEATSAIDIPTEARLYATLVDAGVTFISVGHRETILRFHARALQLRPDGSWDILPTDDVARAAEAIGKAAPGEASRSRTRR